MADSKNNFGKYLNYLRELNSYVSTGNPTPKQLGELYKELEKIHEAVLREGHLLRTLLDLDHKKALRDFDFIPYDSHNPYCRNDYCQSNCQGGCDIDTEALQESVFLKNEEI